MTPLEKRLVLHRFICAQFGYEDLHEMLAKLDGVEEQLAGNESLFAQALLFRVPNNSSVIRRDIAHYDSNIAAYSRALRMTADLGRSWKPFQYLALLFTERYLDLYFRDSEQLVETLNKWKQRHWRRLANSAADLPDYTSDDLRTLAFQSATGSGKTLLLHANILQYKHYLKEYKQLHKLNKIILVTPDEGLSRQHLRELQASGMAAQLFSDRAATEIFSHGSVVDIIDLHKLDEKKGIKRVALESFEENNLVMVDEGHLGTGGKVWRKRRKQLARNGFTFEYSATFNQAVSGGGEEIRKLRDEYGKSILFDYSYKFFYADGYGKDYQISNLQDVKDGEANNLYLLACLLIFYQQCRIYQDKGGQWRDFNLAHPLWVFLGKTVTGGKTAGKKATETDVIRIINFLTWAQSEHGQAVAGITQLINGNAGLVDESGAGIFRESFPYLKENSAQAIYDDLCLSVFHGKGQLHISHLTGLDELQLSVGDESPFGVINVGDASGLYTKLEAVEEASFSLSKNLFTRPLFATVDNSNSPINIVIGARKFVAGWNSWRVSTMGLMHVGTGEGPQIIQMFGRGVRLKGHGMSLKRHTALAGATPADSEQLKLLETLNIFGLKANYMDKFKQYLQKEGVNVDRVTLVVPTRKQFKNVKHLKIIKKRDDVGEFQSSNSRLDLPEQPSATDAVTLDRYKHLQILGSGDNQTGDALSAKQTNNFKQKHLHLINKRAVYHKVLERKQRFSWHNLRISQQTVNKLLENQDWYTLYIPPEKLDSSHYGRVREWEELAVDLICEYANQYWRRERNIWEHKHLEAVPLDDNNPNYFAEYRLAVDKHETDLISDIKRLVAKVGSDFDEEGWWPKNAKISAMTPNFHAYVPLFYAAAAAEKAGEFKTVKISPLALNAGEAKLVESLKQIVGNPNVPFLMGEDADLLNGKTFHLMRNLSRGKGVSFFADYHFYPDFILWIKDAHRQDILFIDPKGLAQFDSRVKSKVDLHKRIKDTQTEIQKQHRNLFLHSYIWSVTQPKDIGSDTVMTRDDCHEKGIFLARGGGLGLIALVKDALNST